jgi:transcriptional/translational regulatory protein YebC/TACO1
VETFKEIIDRLKAAEIELEEAELRMTPNNETELADDEALQVLKVIDALEELDDVQDVYSTLSVSESVMAKFEAA